MEIFRPKGYPRPVKKYARYIFVVWAARFVQLQVYPRGTGSSGLQRWQLLLQYRLRRTVQAGKPDQ